MVQLKRITIFVLHDEDSSDFDWVHAWILKWKQANQLIVANYSSGGWEHIWDIEASLEAVAEVPEDYLCASEWATPDIFKAET
jgi:hypothetical protein